MALSIDINNNTENRAWEICLIGEVDISNVHEFKEQIETALAKVEQNILIDLSGLDYIDSTGLGIIIGVYSSIKDKGLTIKVANPGDSIKKLINITGLDKILY